MQRRHMGEGERHELSRLKLTYLSFSRGLEAGPRAVQVCWAGLGLDLAVEVSQPWKTLGSREINRDTRASLSVNEMGCSFPWAGGQNK